MDDKNLKEELRDKLNELKKEYQYNTPDIMDTDDIFVRKIKWVITNKLDTVERTIILLYAECGSLRKLGAMLNISHSGIRPFVNEIKAKIKTELDNIKDIINI